MLTQESNSYVAVHKVQRNMLCRTIAEFGQIDLEDDAQIEEIAVSIRALRKMIEQHNPHEQQFFHPLIAGAAPQIVTVLDAQHAEIERRFERANTMHFDA